MATPRLAGDLWQSVDERGYPAIIGHASGNSVQGARDAVRDGADFVEVDVWFRKSEFEARHERRMGPIPLLFERWYLRFAPPSPFTLQSLLAEMRDDTGVLLDLKNSQHETAAGVAAILREAPGNVRVMASSQWWPGLRRLHDRAPGVELYYSIDVEAKLDLFRSIIRRDHRPSGVSCRESLLTPALIREMHDHSLRVIAWTVDDLSRAARLASWGVDGITTHLVQEMHALLVPHP